MIDGVRSFGIASHRIEKPGYTGVWVGGSKKIAAIGLKISRWVTMHGVSINVDPDMRYFDNIVPCGITDKDKSVGSLNQFNSDITLDSTASALKQSFLETFCATEIELYDGDAGIEYLNSISAKYPIDTL